MLAEAFADYPWTRWTVDPTDHVARIKALQRLSIVELALPLGEVWAASTVDGAVVSAAVWMRPGSVVAPDVADRVGAATAALEGAHHDRSAEAERILARLRPTRLHYYLGAVGTRPEQQGRGYGLAVLRPVLEQASAERVATYLETSSRANVGFYEARGFRVLAEVEAPGGGPRVWGMLRPPRPSSG